MPKQPLFEIVFAEQIYEHLEAIERKYDSVIREAVETQLLYEPHAQTRNRKRLRRTTGFGAVWEVRCGPNNRFRIFYAIDLEARQVKIVTIATKVDNRLFAGKEELDI